MPTPRTIALGVELLAVPTPTLPPAAHTNCFALGTGDVLLVEPAPSTSSGQRAFVAWVRGLASGGRRPLAIVCTHHHQDHAGGAKALHDALGLPLWAHEQTAALLPGVPFERHLGEGEELELRGSPAQTWRVMHTPGHARGHVCLYEPGQRVVVLGDMIASDGTILIAPGDGDMAQYLAQLRRLEALDAKLGLPAHGEPIEHPSSVLRATHDHRLMRERKVLAAVNEHGAKGATLEQLVCRAYDDTPAAVWPLARLSLQSHLLKLLQEERVDSVGDHWYALGREPS